MRPAAVRSERFQEREQSIGRLKAAERRTYWQGFCQRVFFHGEIRVQLRIRGLYALVSQP